MATVDALEKGLPGAEIGRGFGKEPGDAGRLFQAARRRMREFDLEGYEAAVSLLLRALESDASFAPAHAALAEAYSHWGFRREINGQPSSGCYDLAHESACSALRLAPDSAASHRAMAMALRRGMRGDPERRKEEILLAIGLDPDDADTWYEFWRAFGYGTADKAIERALELDPMHCGAHIDLGAVLCQEGRLPEALAHLTLALRSNPRNSLAAYDLAMVLDRMGDPERALAALEMARRTHPGDPLVVRALAERRT